MWKPTAQTGGRLVRPVLSLSNDEAKLRVINLYRSWYRFLPKLVHDWEIPVTVEMCRHKLREEFYKHKHVRNVRAIDLLVIKGQMELVETVHKFKQKSHLMSRYFPEQERSVDRPTDFMSKFLDGKS